MRLFVSYRRGDSPFVAGRLKDRMVEAFGKRNVFYDVDSIPPGVDFRVVIGERVSKADAVLAVIGPDWEPSRLHSDSDYVRIELEHALASTKRLIPILIAPATMPTVAELPTSLASLPFLNAVPLRPDPDFDTDVNRLLDGLTNTDPDTHGDRRSWRAHRSRAAALVGGVVAVVAAVVVLVAVNDNHSDGSSATSATSASTSVTTTPPTSWTGDSLQSGPNAERWSIATNSAVTVDWSSNGVTIDVSPDATAKAQGWIRTTCTFADDFVVSVAYDVVAWGPVARPRLGVLAMVDDTRMVALERFSDGQPDLYSIDFGNGRFIQAADRPSASGTAGELKLSRRSGYYTAQFRENGAPNWIDIGKGGPSFEQPVSIGISMWSAGHGSRQATAFHDFVVEEGACVA